VTGSGRSEAPAATSPSGAASPGLSVAARRVMEAVTQARETAPAHVVVELPELEGLRVRVSVSGSTVHLALMGESSGQRSGGLVRDVARNLSERGLQLGDVTAGDRRGSGSPDEQEPPATPGARPSTPRPKAAGLRI
jgi:hypothetical protein